MSEFTKCAAAEGKEPARRGYARKALHNANMPQRPRTPSHTLTAWSPEPDSRWRSSDRPVTAGRSMARRLPLPLPKDFSKI